MRALEIDRFGIARHYEDAHGVLKNASRATRATLQAAMGLDKELLAKAKARVRFVSEGEAASFATSGEILLEDGTTRPIKSGEPVTLPLGYHDFVSRRKASTVRVIVAPRACPAPPHMRAWGWAVQLFAARSTQSWGIGDLGDLRTLAQWSKTLGAELLLVNPLTAVEPLPQQQASPYYPSSRRFRNPLYLRVEEIPGASEAGLDLTTLAAAGRAAQ